MSRVAKKKARVPKGCSFCDRTTGTCNVLVVGKGGAAICECCLAIGICVVAEQTSKIGYPIRARKNAAPIIELIKKTDLRAVRRAPWA